MATTAPESCSASTMVRTSFCVVAIGILSTAMAFGIFGRPFAEWQMPLHYDGDALNVLLFVKAGMEQIWPWGSERLGVPGTLDLAVYPMPESIQLLLLKLLSIGTETPAVALNLYLFLTFFLTAASATWALLTLGLPRSAAALGGLVFSLLPAHFWRGEGHMFVNGYYWVPILCVVCLRGARDVPSALAVGAAFVAPLINTYYAFFFAFVFTMMGLCDAIAMRSARDLPRAAFVLGACVCGFVLNMARSLPLYLKGHMAFTRAPSDTELGGLKLAYMLLPAFENVSSRAARAGNLYAQTSLLSGENAWNDLGLLGACALLTTLSATFVYAIRRETYSVAQGLCLRSGLCVLLCVLYGTQGGFSSIFSYLVVPFIRAANRIEAFIVFFSLAAALLIFDAVRGRYRISTQVYAVLLCVLYWDLNHKFMTPDLERTNAIYRSDAAFFAGVERSLPPKARVYQLPYVLYPEGGPVEDEYSQARAFIHTKSIRWSYGVAHKTPFEGGSRQAAWALARGDADAFSTYLRINGFDGILLSRRLARLMNFDYESILDKTFQRVANDAQENDFVLYKVH